ncbi:hypothetical protein [Roseibacillus ishigakijimensis]|nr:hypothetical protein [Roseibacillus ishigakijimensis]
MKPKGQRWVSAEEMLAQTRRNRREAAKLELRTGPVLPEDALRKESSEPASTEPKLKAS